ncbi:hypothetical protein HYH03_004341 [Edaphochlamys debaryana]|uniref:Uncharacterized protein n=1 Tax=Edaphochlamys debaryana TaxID=47281 RepID=A0A835Y7B5_9CHLO|nr:hypothetical protein HYH03_004341 [Edaphochlamys debaryana]|eukprot:KAG2497595.1 hypothetical protein HYH03_004341 [Edaphochlamys debaryana]
MGGEDGGKPSATAGEEPQPKRPREDSSSDVSSFLASWAWKREHRPDRDRFQRPYVHPLCLPGGGELKLTVGQARFASSGPEGGGSFASTVWDSAIVAAKYLERHAGELVAGRRVLDLSAGCGLVALTAAALGASRAVASDLGPNLPLLRRNAERNGLPVEVVEHWWGTDVAPLGGPFDLVVACDCMYIEEAAAVGGGCQAGGGAANAGRAGGESTTTVILAHGRNRFAEAAFWGAAAAAGMAAAAVDQADLHPVYRCSDVDVYRLTLRQGG